MLSDSGLPVGNSQDKLCHLRSVAYFWSRGSLSNITSRVGHKLGHPDIWPLERLYRHCTMSKF